MGEEDPIGRRSDNLKRGGGCRCRRSRGWRLRCLAAPLTRAKTDQELERPGLAALLSPEKATHWLRRRCPHCAVVTIQGYEGSTRAKAEQELR